MRFTFVTLLAVVSCALALPVDQGASLSTPSSVVFSLLTFLYLPVAEKRWGQVDEVDKRWGQTDEVDKRWGQVDEVEKRWGQTDEVGKRWGSWHLHCNRTRVALPCPCRSRRRSPDSRSLACVTVKSIELLVLNTISMRTVTKSEIYK